MKKVVFASGNLGKLHELDALVQALDWQLVPQSEFAITPIEETGTTFVENAILKARHAAECSGLPALADDSGLEVDALQGAPGVFSSRYAGVKADDQANIHKLLTALADVPDDQRSANYRSVLVLMRHARDPSPIICQGTWHGHILHAPRGEGGFGYDPIFYVPTHQCSAAELPTEEKNKISHRGQALQQLISCMKCHKLDDAVL